MPKKVTQITFYTIILILSLAFVAKFGGPNILKQYVAYGIGDCKSIPILCMVPEEKILKPEISRGYLAELTPQEFPKMSVSCPKGFTVVQELISRPFYKKNRRLDKGAVIYLLYQEPGAFIRLYPNVKKSGIDDNYKFMDRLTQANLSEIKNLTGAFFIIMKSVFTPDIGDQAKAKMIKFQLQDKKGFINYNLTKSNNYFDCNVMDSKDNFFKIYIKDIGGRLDLNEVFAIISTIKTIK